MKLKQLIGAEASGEKGEFTVANLTADSRKVKPGTVFVALKGLAVDGHDFIPAALEQGALAVVAGHSVDTRDVPLLIASETRAWLAGAAARFYQDQPGTVVAITGTNGKSSSVDFLRQIWAGAGLKAASLGTLGAIGPSGTVDLGHTTPDPVAIHETLAALARQGVSHLAMEASSHGLEQHRLDGVRL